MLALAGALHCLAVVLGYMAHRARVRDWTDAVDASWREAVAHERARADHAERALRRERIAHRRALDGYAHHLEIARTEESPAVKRMERLVREANRKNEVLRNKLRRLTETVGRAVERAS